MNGDTQSQDDTFFPDASPIEAVILSPPAARRPGALTAICVIAILLGALGGLSATWQTVQAFAGREMQQVLAMPGRAGMSAQAREIQEQYMDAVMAVSDRYSTVNLVLAAVVVVLAAALIFGAVQCLRFRPAGRKVLLLACLLALVFEIARAVPYVLMQLEMMPVIQEYMPRLMEADSPNARSAPGAAFGSAVAKVSIVVGMVFFCGWALVKMVFYGVTARYLHKPSVRALYPPAAKSM